MKNKILLQVRTRYFIYTLLCLVFLFSCGERKCDVVDKKFRPHKVQHVNKSKIYYYYHNTPCDCDGISRDLCLDCNYQKTYKNYVEYYDNGERVWGK
jgi:hypothetical protein